MLLVPPAGFAVAHRRCSDHIPSAGPCIPTFGGSDSHVTFILFNFLYGRIGTRRNGVRPFGIFILIGIVLGWFDNVLIPSPKGPQPHSLAVAEVSFMQSVGSASRSKLPALGSGSATCKVRAPMQIALCPGYVTGTIPLRRHSGPLTDRA